MNKTNGGTTAMLYALSSSNGGKNWTLTFSSSVDSTNYANNSLPNGAYSLNVTVGSINQTFTFFAFFGDFNGDGVVNGADWVLFASDFNQSVVPTDWFMDYYDTGSINGSDYTAFVSNFNQAAPGSYSGPIVWNAQPQEDYYYSSNWQVLEDDTTPAGGGSPIVADQYVWGLAYVDEMVLRDAVWNTSGSYGITNSGLSQRLYLIQDANWNTIGLVAPGGTVEQNFVYDPYGNDTPVNPGATEAVADAYDWMYLHQGGRLDPVTNLYSFRHRDYSPTLGRWSQQDPSGYKDSLSLYAYENNDPICNSDPTGKSLLGNSFLTCMRNCMIGNGVRTGALMCFAKAGSRLFAGGLSLAGGTYTCTLICASVYGPHPTLCPFGTIDVGNGNCVPDGGGVD
jgi:RHS repeat-associated protein